MLQNSLSNPLYSLVQTNSSNHDLECIGEDPTMKSWISHYVSWIRCLEKNWIGFVAWTKDWIGSVAWKSYGLDPLHVKGLDLRGVIRLIEKSKYDLIHK